MIFLHIYFIFGRPKQGQFLKFLIIFSILTLIKKQCKFDGAEEALEGVHSIHTYVLARLRLGILPLEIETGRSRIPSEILCALCELVSMSMISIFH